MSAIAQHRKRFFEAEENEDRFQRLAAEGGGLKRLRQQAASPSGRCAPDYAQAGAYAVGQSTFAAVRALFAEMNDKVIADVLAEYGDNIDAAIKHLNDLRLSQQQAGGAEQQAPGPAQQQAQQAQQQQQQQQQQEAKSSQQQQQQEQQQQASERLARPQRSAEEWVDVVVQQMSAASDLSDAKRRASSVLQAFEQAVLQHAKEQGLAGSEGEKLRTQLAEVARENQLLKRAVAIQNARMHEASQAAQQQGNSASPAPASAEVVQLREALAQLHAKCHALEVQNYSLALHLRQATDAKDPLAAAGAHRGPDVF